MLINLVPDKSANNAPSGFWTALKAAADYLDTLIANPITVNISVGYGEVDGQPLGNFLGAGGPVGGTGLTYSQLRQDLAANATSAADATAVAHLPSSDPTAGGNYYLSAALEKAWGLLPADGTETDGTVGFSSTASFDYNPNQRAVAGETDFVGVAEHELAHAVGRFAGLQYEPNWYSPLDLFRYSAPGSLQLVGGQPAYFSIDGGVTDLNNYDTISDYGDWSQFAGPDSFDSFSYSGVENPITPSDVTEMDVLGFRMSGAPAYYNTDVITNFDQWITTPAGDSTLVTDNSLGGNTVACQGSDTVVCGAGPITVLGASSAAQLQVGLGSGSALVWAGAGEAKVALGTGSNTVLGGSGSLAISGASSPGGDDTVFGGSGGTTSIAGGAEKMLFVGGSGACAVTVGGGGGAAFAGRGGSILAASSAKTFLAGSINGDQLVASGTGGDMLAAGDGNETLDGSAARSQDILFGGTGNGLIRLGHGSDIFVGGAGACTVVAGSGNATMWAGGGADTFQFVAGQSGGNDVISGFRSGTDHLLLSGYPGAPALSARDGATLVKLTDGTQITLVGVSTDNFARLS